MPGFSLTWPASVRCTAWLGRIFNGHKYLKKDIDNQGGKRDDARVRQAPVR